jgi:hypothetical protein
MLIDFRVRSAIMGGDLRVVSMHCSNEEPGKYSSGRTGIWQVT